MSDSVITNDGELILDSHKLSYHMDRVKGLRLESELVL